MASLQAAFIDNWIEAKGQVLDGPPYFPKLDSVGELYGPVFMRRASRATWGTLLEAGVEIYEYQPTPYHTKVMAVDGLWTSVGSTNVGSRSFRLNDEANLNIYDAEFAAGQEALLEEDITRSTRVTFEAWNARPFPDRVCDFLASLLSTQL